MTNRRDFLSLTSTVFGAHALGLGPLSFAKTSGGLDVLILGGTGFIGPHEINYALEQGHRVTMFNRGKRGNAFGDQVEALIGNRDPKVDDGLKALEGRRKWDVVVDNSGYVPRHVQASVDLLRKRCGRYVYVSTVGVYDFDKGSHFTETSPLADAIDTEVISNDSYGPLKAECDLIVQKSLGEKGTIVRPGYIVGPGDHTDRFTYWVNRVNQGGDVLAPSNPDYSVSWVDARDLCPWLMELGVNDKSGIYNASGPSSPMPRRGLLWGLRSVTSEPARFHWPTEAFLRAAELEFPICGTGPDYSFDTQAAMNAGLRYRALCNTAVDTLAWWGQQSLERRSNPRNWLSLKKEAELINKMNLS